MEEAIKKIIKEKATTIFNENQHFDVPMDWETAKINAALKVSAYIRTEFFSTPPSNYGDYATGGTPSEDDAVNYDDADYQQGEDNEEEQQLLEKSEMADQNSTTPYDNLTMKDFLDQFNFYNNNSQDKE